MEQRFKDPNVWFIVGGPHKFRYTRSFQEAAMQSPSVQRQCFESWAAKYMRPQLNLTRDPKIDFDGYADGKVTSMWHAWCAAISGWGALKVAPDRLHEADQPGVLRIDDGVVNEFKLLRATPSEIAPALESLRDHQGRVDEEGVDCIVSRQAVFEVLRFHGVIE